MCYDDTPSNNTRKSHLRGSRYDPQPSMVLCAGGGRAVWRWSIRREASSGTMTWPEAKMARQTWSKSKADPRLAFFFPHPAVSDRNFATVAFRVVVRAALHSFERKYRDPPPQRSSRREYCTIRISLHRVHLVFRGFWLPYEAGFCSTSYKIPATDHLALREVSFMKQTQVNLSKITFLKITTAATVNTIATTPTTTPTIMKTVLLLQSA